MERQSIDARQFVLYWSNNAKSDDVRYGGQQGEIDGDGGEWFYHCAELY